MSFADGLAVDRPLEVQLVAIGAGEESIHLGRLSLAQFLGSFTFSFGQAASGGTLLPSGHVFSGWVGGGVRGLFAAKHEFSPAE
jgi:hypothetical protein